MKVDDNSEDEDGGSKVHQVGQVLSVKSLPESAGLVLPGGEEMEECDHGSFKLCSTSSVDSGRRDCLPHMVSQMFLAIDREITEPRPDNWRLRGLFDQEISSLTVSLLEKFVQEKNNEPSYEELDDDQKTDSSSCH